MPDDSILHIDDDWKAQARKEKEQLSESSTPREAMPDASFAGLIDLLAMQAMVGLGLVVGPGGERIPPQPEVAKHFIDMLQVLEDKTRNNLAEPEKKLLDQVLYQMRMSYVQIAGGMGPAPAV